MHGICCFYALDQAHLWAMHKGQSHENELLPLLASLFHSLILAALLAGGLGV